jgi:hypothetical protein
VDTRIGTAGEERLDEWFVSGVLASQLTDSGGHGLWVGREGVVEGVDKVHGECLLGDHEVWAGITRAVGDCIEAVALLLMEN